MSIDGVLLTVLAVLVGLVVGFVRRGRLERIASHPVRAKTLLVIGVVVPALADRFTREVAVPLVVVALAALFAFALANVRLVGMSVMAIGILANLLATFLNDGMPVRAEALVAAGLATNDEVDRVELSGARRLEEPTHRLRVLGDIIPLEETGQVLSFGDLVILVGLADITANLTLRRRRRDDEAAEADDDDGRDALDEIARVLHASRPRRAGGGGPRPQPRTAAVVVADDGPPVVLDLPDRAPDVEWFAPYPPRGTFWLDAPAEAPDAVAEPPRLDPPPPTAADLVPDPVPVLEPVPEVVVDEVVDDVADDTVADEVADDTVADDTADEVAPPPPPPPPPDEAIVDLTGDAPVVDLVPVADALADEPVRTTTTTIDLVDDPLAALFRDLTPKKRGRRRGGRNIPDFEPVHIDDAVSPRR